MNLPQRIPYVALDRDGTVLNYVPYLTECADVCLAPTAGLAIARLNQAEVRVVLVTNQSVISRGALTLAELDAIHERMANLLAEHGAHIDDILVCPHAREDRCECRKPLPGLLVPYLEQKGLEPSSGYVVGDNVTDIEFALNIGAKPVHVQGGVHSALEIGARYAGVPSLGNLSEVFSLILGEKE